MINKILHVKHLHPFFQDTNFQSVKSIKYKSHSIVGGKIDFIVYNANATLTFDIAFGNITEFFQVLDPFYLSSPGEFETIPINLTFIPVTPNTNATIQLIYAGVEDKTLVECIDVTLVKMIL